ncbi:MAG TPA: hypothetical protein VFT53_02710 [Candidatus Saccharimonadales bacterium]|nr:hypothetical protein [Candidatus Saccharimonadales bacterium]
MNPPQPKMPQETIPDILSHEGRPLVIDNKGTEEEIGYELPPVPVQSETLDDSAQHAIDEKNERFMETLNSLEWRDGRHTMYEALNGINKQPKLVDDAGDTIAAVTNPQAMLVALSYEGQNPAAMRFLLAKTAGDMQHGKLIEAAPDLLTCGENGQEAPTLQGVLSTVRLADGGEEHIAALYDFGFNMCTPQQVDCMLNTLKAQGIIPIAGSSLTGL